jgi:lipoyl(octanoyl) transferase
MVQRQDIATSLAHSAALRWETSAGLVDFETAVTRMDLEVENIARNGAKELVWLLQHPPLYTAGTSANPQDLVSPNRFPIHTTGRGGQYTYHGPGQRIAYVMLDLKKRSNDVRAFVAGLEQWIISTLNEFGIVGERREDRVGVWVRHGAAESKIAALGIRVRHGISLHGISINLNPDLEHFSGIVPCGVTQHGVTSFAALGNTAEMADLDAALRRNFAAVFEA